MRLMHYLSPSHTRLGAAVIRLLAIGCLAGLASCGWPNRVHNKETVYFEGGLRESRQVITGKAIFHGGISANLTDVEIEGDKKTRGRIQWPATAPNSKSLDSSAPWHFELLEYTNRECSQTVVMKIRVRKELVFDASICEVHHLPMTRAAEVLDEFAGRRTPPEFVDSQSRKFPHTGTAFPACNFYDHFWVTWRCPQCVKEGKVWCQKHLSNAPYL